MGNKGGAMPGAGRPKGAETHQTKIRRRLKTRWLELVDENAESIFAAHFSLALGHYKEVQTPDGTVRVYKTSPHGASIEWMLEHIWGKAPVKIDLNVDENKNVIHQIVHIVANKEIYGKTDDDLVRIIEGKVIEPGDLPANETPALEGDVCDIERPPGCGVGSA